MIHAKNLYQINLIVSQKRLRKILGKRKETKNTPAKCARKIRVKK